MDIISQNNYTASWALWPHESERDARIEVTIDRALDGYLFYPESEWSKYGYRPPENFPLIGAWRNPVGSVFIFLLDQTPRDSNDNLRQFLLYVAGNKTHVNSVGTKITGLKKVLARTERKKLQGKNAGLRLEGEKKAQSIERLIKLIGLFAIIINALSLYLRKLPPPTFPSKLLNDIYQLVMSMVHFSALLLLLLIIVISLFYAFHYGLLLLRRIRS